MTESRRGSIRCDFRWLPSCFTTCSCWVGKPKNIQQIGTLRFCCRFPKRATAQCAEITNASVWWSWSQKLSPNLRWIALLHRDARTRQHQGGFRLGSSCIDQIFTFCEILEQIPMSYRRMLHRLSSCVRFDRSWGVVRGDICRQRSIQTSPSDRTALSRKKDICSDQRWMNFIHPSKTSVRYFQCCPNLLSIGLCRFQQTVILRISNIRTTHGGSGHVSTASGGLKECALEVGLEIDTTRRSSKPSPTTKWPDSRTCSKPWVP